MLVFIFLNLLITCKGSFRIVDGTNADISEYPFMVSILNKNVHWCGGTQLNRQFILTAAHCICLKNIDFKMLSAQFQYSALKLNLGFEKFKCHDYDDLELINDLAVAKLEVPIPDPFYSPVRLTNKNFTTIEEHLGIVLGWGAKFSGGVMQDQLQKASLIVYNDSTCASSYSGIRNVDCQICAGMPEDGTGTCQGDSGGPLLVDSQQVGIISFGAKGNCSISNRNQPKIFVRISKYLEWIRKYSNSSVDFNDDDSLDTTISSTTINFTSSVLPTDQSTTTVFSTNKPDSDFSNINYLNLMSMFYAILLYILVH